MISQIIRISVRHRVLFIILSFMVFIGGFIAYYRLPVEAFPDISPVMVPVFAEAHGMAPEEVERFITFPIESAMNGLPHVTGIKSTSAFGMAAVYVYFEDNIDIYFARQIVSERLQSVASVLPEIDEPPSLGPISTGLGQIFIYYLTLDPDADTGGKDRNTYLREINDWIIKFHLQTVPGVTEILSIGGHVLQFQVNVDPYALLKYGLVLEDVMEAVRKNNRNVGAQFIVVNSEEFLVRGIGLLKTLDDIASIRLKTVRGFPVLISDIADVKYGNEIRRGVVTRNGEEEVVSGIVFQLYGANTSRVIDRLYKKLPEVRNILPKGVSIVPYYEQADLILKATGTVKNALFMGILLVLVTLMAFLGNLRAAVIVIIALPFCALIAVIFMGITGISANLMSLGGIAIAIGMLGDGAIVLVENIFRMQSDPGRKETGSVDLVADAAAAVGKPVVFSILIIIIVFLPLLTLKGIEGKMFSPLAFTISFALIGSIASVLFLTPALSAAIIKPGSVREVFFFRWIRSLYEPSLKLALKFKKTVLVFILICFGISIMLIRQIGTEFIPTLQEGSILIGVTMAPSISLEKATETVMKIEKIIMKFGPVKQTVSRIGRPETGAHPHPVNYAEIHVELHPKEQWAGFRETDHLVSSMENKLSLYPGIQLNFTQPIQNAFDELLSGIKTELAIKIYGEDLKILEEKAEELKNLIDQVPGLADLSVEQSFGQPQLQIRVDRSACSLYGVDVSSLLDTVKTAIGGETAGQVFLNTRRFNINVRYRENYRNDQFKPGNILIRTDSGELVKLSMLADIRRVTGPIQINRENNMRRWVVQANIRGRDMGSVVKDIKNIIKEKITLPPGYSIGIGGQFENQERAMAQLKLIVPLSILLIVLLLYLTFRSLKNALLIILNIPLGLIGGVFGLYIFGEYLSVPASIGFIALFGVAVQNGVVLVSHINGLAETGISVEAAVFKGAVDRLRPVLMTAMTTVLGLVPLLLSRGTGAEVQRPLAVVVVNGLISSTFLTLILIPVLYTWFSGRTEKSKEGKRI